jgi:hypothetical protein
MRSLKRDGQSPLPLNHFGGLRLAALLRLITWRDSMSKRKLAALMAATRKPVLALVAVAGSIVGAQSAMAADPASAVEAVSTLSGSSTGFGPVMWGLAIGVVGILVGVKWIHRAKGAA